MQRSCFGLFATVWLAGCNSEGPAAVPSSKLHPQTAQSPSAERRFTLTGIVKKIDRENGLVAIRHDAIEGYMPVMTMPFSLNGQEVLEDLQVGDKVSGTLKVNGDESALVDVTVTEMADPSERLAAEAAARRLRPGDLVPDFAMRTQDGEPLKLSDLRGNVVALTFIYTRCPLPDYCPAMDRKFAELSRRIKLLGTRADAVRLLSVSFDPEHDTPEVLARHARIVGAKPPVWRFAVADHAELRQVLEPLGLSYGPANGEIIHTLTTVLIDRDGRLLRLDSGNGWDVGHLFSAVRAALGSK